MKLFRILNKRDATRDDTFKKEVVALAGYLKRCHLLPQSRLQRQDLIALPGIGRKSANVIMREAGVKAEGVMVDLHVVRVRQRLGIATSADPKKIEQ